MATIAVSALSSFYRPLRMMLDDHDATARKYEDAVLADALRTALQLNKLPKFSLTPDENSLTPEMTDPNEFALLSYHTCLLFIAPLPERSSWRTRAYAESVASSANKYLVELKTNIHLLENGTMFSAWQNLYCWFAGMSGLPLGEVLTEFNVEAPLYTASLTADGVSSP